MRARTTRALTALLVPLALLWGPAVSVAAPQPSSPPPVDRPPALRAVDTTSKGSVNKAYWSTWVPAAKVGSGWTGDVDGCVVGADSDRHRKATQRALGFVRALGGLGKVAFDPGLGAAALKAALIMDANDALNHYPPQDWKCWTQAGSDAAGKSNLHLQWGSKLTVGSVLSSYLGDAGDDNDVVGHRRWLLYPPATTMGTGSTTRANALYVFGATDAGRPDPAYVGWPTAGWFPNTLEPGGRWSLSAGDDSADFSIASVQVTRVKDGSDVPVTVHTPVTGYGEPTIVWEMPGDLKQTGGYRVSVTNIKAGGSATATSYVVRLFKPVKPS